MNSKSTSKQDRRLVAILFADIVGYTAMMQSDEGKAMSRLRHYQNVLDDEIQKNNGQIIKNYGDGSLCVFSSVLDAVNCAKGIQERLSKEPKVPLRIGLHLGDIMYEGNDIYGDALNIASRIESMGVAGAVLLSNDIYKKVKNQADLRFQSLSSFEFKNVDEPMEIYALANTGMTIPRADEMKGKISETSNSNWPKVLMGLGILAIMAFSYLYLNGDNSSNSGASIAVLPFADMSPQQDQEYFSDGLSEELLNVLAKVKDMKVAGRTSSFKYKGVNDDVKKIGAELGVDHILEGSVRKSGNNIRVTAQLIKVEDGFHMWTETYDKKYSTENIFNIQDEISNEVLKVLKVKLLGNDVASDSKKVATQNTEAYEAYFKGIQLSRNQQPKDIEKAIEYFKIAISLDPKFSLAYSHLALAYQSLVWHGSLNREEAIDAIKNNADKAFLLDSSSGMANLTLAHSFGFQREFQKMYEAGKRAFALEPNNPSILIFYATSVLDNDDADLRTELLEKAYGIDPLSPTVIENLSRNYDWNENYVKARELAEKNVAINPDYVSAHRNLVRLLRGSPNGRLDEAFIHGYKAYKQFPENIEVLRELSYMAIDLHLYIIADDVVEKITQLYPENSIIRSVKQENYFHQNDFTNYVKTIEEFLDLLNLNENNAISDWIEIYYYSGKRKETIDYLKTYHPIYLSDTLTSIPNDRERSLAVVAAMLRHSGDFVQSNRLSKIYCDYVNSEFEHNGDLKKEKRNTLRKYCYCASLSGDGKLAAEIGEELYFNRRQKINAFDGLLHNILTDLISDTPEFSALDARITKDINAMRDNTIVFLKAEGVWIEDVKD